MSRISKRISIQSKDKGDLLVLLEEAQSKFGCLSQEVMSELAESVGISLSEVYGAATFYAFLSTKTQGRNVIRICKSLPCFLKNSELIIESVGREIGIRPGETTPDGKFTFQLTNCIGACDKAPAMLINNEVHGDLTSEKISAILKACE